MSLYSRHPRYTLGGLFFLFVCVIFFFSSPPPEWGPERPYPMGPVPPMSWGTSTLDRVQQAERHYGETLRDRKELIKKYGPSVNKIASFPSQESGLFYTLWDFFIPSFSCPHRVQRVGTMGDGGKWVCGLERVQQKKECVIYSVGINGESSFESQLLEKLPNCKVFGYDFSVRSFGPEIEDNPSLAARSHFRPYMLSGSDKHSPSDNPKQYTLGSLMRMNGHSFIDILKIDIEGAEFETLDTLIDAYAPGGEGQGAVLPFGQLQLEIHARDSAYDQFPRFLQWWEKLERAGLRPFFSEPNLVYINLVRGAIPTLSEYSFINIRGKHELISDNV